MALKLNYKPYTRRSRKNRRSKKVLTFLFLLIICIAVVLTVKSFQKDPQPQQPPVNLTQLQPAPSEKPAQRNSIEMPPQNASNITSVDTPTTPTPQPEVQIETPVQPASSSQNSATLAQLQQIEAKAKELIKDRKIIEARDILNETLKLPLTAQQRNDLKSMLASFSDIWLFSDKVLPKDNICSIYQVQSGEVPSMIGQKFDLPWQFILKINNIDDPKRLWAGAKIKVVKGPFTAKIYRSTFTMDVFIQDTYVKSYKVGLGKIGPQGNPTPTGLWKVKSHGKGKLIRPPWPDPVTGKFVYYEDSDYPLGERWIGLDGIDGQAKGRNGFGIHGTNQPESIGQFASDGCIRMLNEDVIEFYNMATEGLTEIQVVD